MRTEMILYWLISALFLRALTDAAEALRSTEYVYKKLHRIETILEEDRTREHTKIIDMDKTLKNIETQLNKLADMLEDDLGRGISLDLRSDLQSIGERIEKMEFTADSLKTMMSKMDADLAKLEQVEQRTKQLEKELEHRLTKLMNAISSLHEMNKGLSNHLRSGNKVEEPNELSTSSFTHLREALEEAEKTLKEQLSILEVQLRKELDSLRILTSNALVRCEPSEEHDENEDIQPRDFNRQGTIPNEKIDLLMRNLSRSQHEMREEFDLGMKGLDQKITELSSINANCGSESSTRISTAETPQDAKPKCVSDQMVSDARNCADLRKSGTTCDGVYFIFHSRNQAIKLYCDMTTDGGGWTVIMRRGDFGTTPIGFNLPWRVYKQGFGDMNREFWLGNEYIHLLTTGYETNQLRIELESFDGVSKNFTYDAFSIGNENDEYRMHVKDPLGGWTSSNFLYYNNRPFVTYDRITDQPGDCAKKYKGGWWYRRHCMYPVLTGERFGNETRTSVVGMQSQLWREAGILKAAEMKIRPKNFHV